MYRPILLLYRYQDELGTPEWTGKNAIPIGTAHTGRYVPVCQLTGTRTACYRAVLVIRAVSAPLPPVGNDRFRSSSRFWAVSAKEGRKKKREKKNLEFGVALRMRDPSLASDFFACAGRINVSPCGEKE
ncbi:hypothetical protein B296_00053364 [Ensete ventricosum]|uniref:Uncharacterized protein n=1 Tax=Ensete ventricosum TaxID=4639 RepID=A0A426XKY9_ENSVE|nr:hypothetical protein B296_00053364 [Ensete ventricosum]